MFALLALVASITQTAAFVSYNNNAYRLQPVRENFFLDIAEDPAVNTPKQIFGEVAYKSFVSEYKPNALIVGGPKYDIIERVRELKLLKLSAESGLIETLESKGLTLSKLEKLLPLADSLGLLPLLVKNKELLLNVAPAIIEPAPAIIPLLVSLLKTSPTNFYAVGLTFLGLGVYESTDSFLLGAPLVLAGLPVTLIGVVLSVVTGFLGGDIPSVRAESAAEELVVSFSTRPTVKSIISSRPTVGGKVSDAPRAENGKRKLVKINSR